MFLKARVLERKRKSIILVRMLKCRRLSIVVRHFCGTISWPSPRSNDDIELHSINLNLIYPVHMSSLHLSISNKDPGNGTKPLHIVQ